MWREIIIFDFFFFSLAKYWNCIRIGILTFYSEIIRRGIRFIGYIFMGGTQFRFDYWSSILPDLYRIVILLLFDVEKEIPTPMPRWNIHGTNEKYICFPPLWCCGCLGPCETWSGRKNSIHVKYSKLEIGLKLICYFFSQRHTDSVPLPSAYKCSGSGQPSLRVNCSGLWGGVP